MFTTAEAMFLLAILINLGLAGAASVVASAIDRLSKAIEDKGTK